MKRFTFLIVAFTIAATGAQAYGQLDGGNGWTFAGPQPEPPNPESVFYASLTAYQLAQNEANYWRAQRYHPYAPVAAQYFQISANYQYQALVRVHSVWTGLENRGYITPFERQLAEEAETCSLYADWYAIAGASSVGRGWHIVQAAAEAYDKIELLVRELDHLLRPEPQY